MSSISRNSWVFEKCSDILKNKEELRRTSVSQMLNKTISMFKYKNLPDTIKPKDIELITQVNGYCIWKDVDGKLYVFYGSLGGEPNVYYLPTKAIIANPALKYNATLEIDSECVVMKNDYLYQGLIPMFNKYASLETEGLISLKIDMINARIPALVQADNDNTYNSAVEFLKQIYDGGDYGVIASKEFFEGIKAQDFFKVTHIKDIIEAIQYVRGSLYNEIGLKASFNMKREAINEAEAAINDDVLYPTVDTMLECRKEAIEKVNSMFGTNIEVELNSIWEQNRIQEKLAIETMKKEAEVKTNNESNRDSK